MPDATTLNAAVGLRFWLRRKTRVLSTVSPGAPLEVVVDEELRAHADDALELRVAR